MKRKDYISWDEYFMGVEFQLVYADARALRFLNLGNDRNDVFRYLLAYVERDFSEIDPTELRRMLCTDFSMHENKNPPAFLLRNR